MARKTLLDVVKRACYLINEPAPSALYGSTDPNVLQLLNILYQIGDQIRNDYDYPTLKTKFQFSTTSGTKFYPLPGDFYRLGSGTQWDESNQWAMFGPEDDAGIVERDIGLVPFGTQYSYRIVGALSQDVAQTSFDRNAGYIEISPTPTEVRELYIEYIKTNWFYPKQWVASTAYTTGAFISANGNIYKVTNTASSNTVRPTGESGVAGTYGISYQLWRDEYDDITADTDYPIIEPGLLVQGLVAHFAGKKGLDQTAEQLKFNNMILQSIGRFHGATIINGDGNVTYDFPNISEGFVSTGW